MYDWVSSLFKTPEKCFLVTIKHDCNEFGFPKNYIEVTKMGGPKDLEAWSRPKKVNMAESRGLTSRRKIVALLSRLLGKI